MQRLLLEGMRIVYDDRQPGSVMSAGEECPLEVYGHLAAALRPQMVEATDERLLTLASIRFAPVVIAFAFTLGAASLVHIATFCHLAGARYGT